jgi:flagellar biosynthetic protein FliR
VVAQQVLIGVAMGFAVRMVFAAVEFAGELIGLQMGLNFAGFFDPGHRQPGHGHQPLLRHAGGLAVRRHQRPSAADPGGGAELRGLSGRPELPVGLPAAPAATTLGHARSSSPGLWIALPLVAMLLFVNLVLGVISRVAAAASNVFAVGFPIT